MMKHMMLFYPLHQGAFKIIMMHGIMQHIVYQVAGNKTGIEWIEQCLIGKQQGKQKIKTDRQWNAGRRRHHQPFCIFGIIVVYAMEDEMNAFAPLRCWFKMKNKTMEYIFGNGPYNQAQYQEQ